MNSKVRSVTSYMIPTLPAVILLLCLRQASYDDVLERLKGQSTALLQALSNGGGMAGAADETALAQVCVATCSQKCMALRAAWCLGAGLL
jgi:hypothetical protein